MTKTHIRPYTVNEDMVREATGKITDDEKNAIALFEAQKKIEQEEQAYWEKGIEDRYLVRFTAKTEENAPVDIMDALATIAAFFHNDDPQFIVEADVDPITGVEINGTDPNNAQFNQKGIMGNLVQQADWMLQREERRLGYLLNEANKARRAYAREEISGLALEKAELDYGRCKLVNIPLLEDFKKAAKTAYLVQYGEEWTRPVRTDTRATTERLEDRFAHAKAARRL